MDIILNNSLAFIIAPLLIAALINIFLIKENFKAKKLTIISNILALLVCAILFYFKEFNALNFTVIFSIILSALMGATFSALGKSKVSHFSLINFIAILTLIAFTKNELAIVLSCLFSGFVAIFFSLKYKSFSRKILLIYCAISLSILAISYLFFQKYYALILVYFAILPLIGIFPFQSWYLSFFRNSPFGVIIVFNALQAITATTLVNFLHLENFLIMQIGVALATLFSSIIAVIQKQTRNLLAYLISSQLGFLIFATLVNQGNSEYGAIFMTLSFIAATGGFLAMIAALESRKKDLLILQPSGCYESYPKLAFYLFIFGAISCGLPLSIGYIGEDLIFERNFLVDPTADILCLIAVAINTISIVKIFLYLCHGKSNKETGIDLRKAEVATALFLLIFIIFTTSLSLK